MEVLERVLQRLDSLFSVDPNLAKVPPEVRRAAINLLNRVTNGVDLLLSLKPTPRGWTARFLENGKPVEATWDGKELVTVLLSDLAVPGNRRRDARKNCTKGRWCVGKTGRGTCIAANKKCRQELKEQEMAAADRLSEALRQAVAQPQPARRAAPSAPRTQQTQTPTPTLAYGSEERNWGQEREPWMDETAKKLGVPPALVENVFRMAEAMGGRYVLVYLNELRKKFPDVPRDLLDDVLLAMSRQAKIVLMNLDDPLSVTPEIDKASINLWGYKKHVLRVRN